MDYIHLEKFIVRGKHGVYEEERKVEQEFELHLKLGVGDTSGAAKSCNIEDAVDYGPIKQMIEEVISSKSVYLIETLADIIATNILKDPRIKTLELTINKPEVWPNAVPGLTIYRENK